MAPTKRLALLAAAAAALTLTTHAQVVRDERPQSLPAAAAALPSPPAAAQQQEPSSAPSLLRRRKGTREEVEVVVRGPVGAVGGYDEALANAMVDFAGTCVLLGGTIDRGNGDVIQPTYNPQTAAAYYCRSGACETWACSACRRHPNANVTRIYGACCNGMCVW